MNFAQPPDHHVVVHDPESIFWEGAIIAAASSGALRARGCVTLPVQASLINRSAVGGYFRRSWGSGWPLGTTIPKMACPLVLYVVRDDGCRSIHWVARLVADRGVADAVRAGAKIVGNLRLASDSGQPAAFSGGFAGNPRSADGRAQNLVEGERLGQPDADDGWTVYGQGLIHPPSDGIVALGLWGQLQGLRVAWAAVTQSR